MSRVTFKHGVHPPELKQLTATQKIRRMPFPSEVVLPLRQHAGKPAKLLVKRGDHVERGDLVAAADGFMSVPVHASASGRVAEIGFWPHPDGSMCEAVRLVVDRYSTQLPRPRVVPRWEGLTREQVVAAVQQAGIVGLGGAAFPAHVKLVPPKDTRIELLLLNGAECEPYLTTDHRLMAEQPERVLYGARIMMHALGVTRCVIGVERNKPDAIAALTAALPTDIDIKIQPLTVKYPQGAEKMLIKSVVGKEVPSGKLPLHVGVIVQNVGTVATIGEVFETGLPLVERVVTITGPGVRKPSNLLLPIGTRLGDALEYCGGLSDDVSAIVFGGPMMGAAQSDLDTPIIKGVTGVLALTRAVARTQPTMPCIKCGRCLDACPVFLNPSQLGLLAQAGRFEEMEAAHLADCMLCGSCSYVCPSNIPLAQMFALGKAGAKKQKARAAALAATAAEAGVKAGAA